MLKDRIWLSRIRNVQSFSVLTMILITVWWLQKLGKDWQ